jgi:alpha-D-ribose 1-methylphosphonate 5-triphosphate synthase subunit PhnG
MRSVKTPSCHCYNPLLDELMDDVRVSSDGARAAAMRLFALAPWALLDELTRDHAETSHEKLRGPETGLIMLQGRMGATGDAFNFGEATVTRYAIRLPNGVEGHAYILGRNADHAKRAALCDALFQAEPDRMTTVLDVLKRKLQSSHQMQAAKAAATRVEFFTMVRGDD